MFLLATFLLPKRFSRLTCFLCLCLFLIFLTACSTARSREIYQVKVMDEKTCRDIRAHVPPDKRKETYAACLAQLAQLHKKEKESI